MKKVIAKDKEHLKQLINTALSKKIKGVADLNFIDTSFITDMSFLFEDVEADFDISAWDVSKVKNMKAMFYHAHAFNQNIGAWDVSKVTDMCSMFQGATVFNQGLQRWDVNNVIEMYLMFCDAKSFNQDISDWNVSNVRDMQGMFCDASSFNQDISRWDVSTVTDISNMFYAAKSFNQDLSNWNLLNLQCLNYDVNEWMHIDNLECFNDMFGGPEGFDLQYAPNMIYQLAGVNTEVSIATSLADLIHSLELINIEIALNMAQTLGQLEDTKMYVYKYLVDAELLGKIKEPNTYTKLKEEVQNIINLL